MNIVAALPDAHESFFQDWTEDYVRGPSVTPSARGGYVLVLLGLTIWVGLSPTTKFRDITFLPIA